MTGDQPEPLTMPADEFAALKSVARHLGMLPPSPVSPGAPADATVPRGTVSGEAVTAAQLADVEYARKPPRPAVWESLSTERVRNLLEAGLEAELARAEQDRAKLAAITAHCRDHLELAGAERGSVCCPHLAEDILAIIGSEETRDA